MHSYSFEQKIMKCREISIITLGTVSAALFTVFACISLSSVHETESINGERPDIIISGPFGTYEIYGAKDWLDPVIEQGRRMNKIEAMENHAQFPEMSDRPEDYTDGR